MSPKLFSPALSCLAIASAVVVAREGRGQTPGAVRSHQKISELCGGFSGGPDVEAFGGSVASLGDLDGDGVPDIAVGAPKDNDGSGDTGSVWILFLNADGTLKSQAPRIAAPPLSPQGTYFGWSVAPLGDMDGDGVVDLAVGAPCVTCPQPLIETGAVWILFLNDDGTVKSSEEISDGVGGFNSGASELEDFGGSVASLGDLDGDGMVDLAVGAPRDNNEPPDVILDVGVVWILFLNPAFLEPDEEIVKGQQKISNSAGGFAGSPCVPGGTDELDVKDYFGTSVAYLGDLGPNAPTRHCLAVGARWDADTGTNSGAVWVLFLQSDGMVDCHQKITAPEGDPDEFGTSVASLGDLNGDGVPDLAVGAPLDDDGGGNQGAMWILLLDEDGTVKSQHRISDLLDPGQCTLDPLDELGASVASVGDLDNDGVAELAVGAPRDNEGNARGAVWVLWVYGESNVPFEDPVETPAQGEGDHEAVGDLDGDGDIDVVMIIPDQDLIQVFLNKGNLPSGVWDGLLDGGTFPVGDEPSGVALGRLNGDQYLDVAVTNAADATVSLL
jgi:hypothetical protein